MLLVVLTHVDGLRAHSLSFVRPPPIPTPRASVGDPTQCRLLLAGDWFNSAQEIRNLVMDPSYKPDFAVDLQVIIANWKAIELVNGGKGNVRVRKNGYVAACNGHPGYALRIGGGEPPAELHRVTETDGQGYATKIEEVPLAAFPSDGLGTSSSYFHMTKENKPKEFDAKTMEVYRDELLNKRPWVLISPVLDLPPKVQ